MNSTTSNPNELPLADSMSLKDSNLETNSITFMTGDKEIIKMTKDGFYYLGEYVKDPFEVYIRFHEYLKANNI
jgi:hypothetical protein